MRENEKAEHTTMAINNWGKGIKIITIRIK